MPRTRLTALLVTALLTMAACGEPPATPTTAPTAAGASTSSAPTPTMSGSSSVENVPTTLTFTAKTLDGKDFDGATLAGKPTVLWFWAPWCSVCRGQSSSVASSATRLSGKVNFVGVAGLDDEPAMRTFVSGQKLGDLPHLSDKAGVVWKKFGVTSQSTFVLIDGSGKVVHKGFLNGADLAERAGKLT